MVGKYRAYFEYKDSDIDLLGEIPVEWKVLRYKNILKIMQGMAFKSSEYVDSSSVINIRMGNIKKGGSIDLKHNTKYLPEKYKSTYSDYELHEGDAIIAMTDMSPTLDFLAVPAILEFMDENATYLLNQRVGKLLLNKEFDIRFVRYLLLSEELRTQLKAKGLGTVQANMSNDDLYSSYLFCPSVAERLDIVSFLDHETAKIDTLIEKQQQLIKLLKEKRQAVISHAVTKGLNPNAPMRDSGVEWLGEVPAHWEVRSVSKLSQKITNGYVGPTRDILVPKGVPYVQATHIKKGKVNFDNAYFVKQSWSDSHAKSILVKGDVLIVQTGAGTGDIGLVSEDEEGFNCHALIIVQPRKDIVIGEYLSMAFQTQYGYSVLYSIRTGGMHPHLNCGEVQFVKLPVPPLNEQDQIIEYISNQIYKFDTLVERQLKAIELMQERRTALISAAVTGKIDVRNWLVPEPSNTVNNSNKEVAA
jgi:type I restriction enzyme S subunit